jgi:hypothetical protein
MGMWHAFFHKSQKMRYQKNKKRNEVSATYAMVCVLRKVFKIPNLWSGPLTQLIQSSMLPHLRPFGTTNYIHSASFGMCLHLCKTWLCFLAGEDQNDDGGDDDGDDNCCGGGGGGWRWRW